MGVQGRSRADEGHVSGIHQSNNDGLFSLIAVSQLIVELEGNGDNAQSLLIELVSGIEVTEVVAALVVEEKNESSLVSSGDGVSDNAGADTDLDDVVFEEGSLGLEASNFFFVVGDMVDVVVVFRNLNTLAWLVDVRVIMIVALVVLVLMTLVTVTVVVVVVVESADRSASSGLADQGAD